MRPLTAHCHLGLGKLYWRTGKRQEAQEHLTAATVMYRKMDMQFWLEQAAAELRNARGEGRGPSVGGEGQPLEARGHKESDNSFSAMASECADASRTMHEGEDSEPSRVAQCDPSQATWLLYELAKLVGRNLKNVQGTSSSGRSTDRLSCAGPIKR